VQHLRTVKTADGNKNLIAEDISALLATIATQKEAVKLAAGTPWFVLHPDLRFLRVWDLVVFYVSQFFFVEVPFNIAFRAAFRLGAQPQTERHHLVDDRPSAAWVDCMLDPPGCSQQQC
jgi:hypothetical protein